MAEDPGSSGLDQVQKLVCNGIDELLLFNETYSEIVDSSLQLINQQLIENRHKQKMLEEERRAYARTDLARRKVPVHLYMPPYFKDENGMCPPMSAEARKKQELNWFDPLMKEEKKWTPAEIRTLREAVCEAMIGVQLQPLTSRRDLLTYKIRNTDVTTSDPERRQWVSDLEDVLRKIDYVKKRPADEVLTASADYSVVAWNEIANVQFKGTRTEWAVKTKWMNELNPKWNTAPWTMEEMETMRKLREDSSFTTWHMLALTLNTRRTPFQCMEKYKTEIAQQTREWTHDEDTKLVALTKMTALNGHIQWDKVAQFMPGRTRQQVRSRFSHTLDTSVKHGRWTDQEDMLLMCAVSRHGARDWAKIAQSVQHRNDSQCRERWNNVLNRSAHVSERFTLAEDEKLLYAVKIFGKGSWAKCQMLMPRKTGRQLRRRYLQLIAAKLKMVAGFCNAVDAMKSGRREAEEDELVEDDALEAANIPNELMVEAYEKLMRTVPEVDESVEDFVARIDTIGKPVAARIRNFKNRPDYPQIEEYVRNISKKNQGEIDEELQSTQVLSQMRITEIDIRYMVAVTKRLRHRYRERAFRKANNVDKSECRVRPLRVSLDQSQMPVFEDECSEEEKIMRTIESLCFSIQKTDTLYWGRQFWTENRKEAATGAKMFVEMMVREKSEKVAEWLMVQDGSQCPPKTTLPPSRPSFDLTQMVQRARSGLNQLSARHFYPVDVGLDEQKTFTTNDRETLGEETRMNIRLADEVTKSRQFCQFYARMRTILLEPMRLQFAKESAVEERDRLRRELDLEARVCEEEGVVDGTLQKTVNEEISADVTSEPIRKMLEEGMKIDTSCLFAHLEIPVADQHEKKRRIDDIVEEIAKRARCSPGDDVIDSGGSEEL